MTVRRIVATYGGMFSRELGIDVAGGEREVARWFCAATLFGTRISASVAVRTYRTLATGGVHTVGDAAACSRAELVALLDQGGYARYDERTARRLQHLATVVTQRFPDGLDAFGRACADPLVVEQTLDDLPGWGPVTVHAFLRELRGVWPAAEPPLDERVVEAAHDAGLVAQNAAVRPTDLRRWALVAGVGPRDLEAALLRASLARGTDHVLTGGQQAARRA